jgi:hypothetical protein
MTEIEDLSVEHYRDKKYNQDTINELHLELKLYKSIALTMLTQKSISKIQNNIKFHDKWA